MAVVAPGLGPETSDANEARRELKRPRYRKCLLRLTPEELNNLRRAFEGLYAVSQTVDDTGAVDPAGNPNDERGYQWVTGVHGAPTPVYCEHGTLHFLTWHRAYLYRFEKLLQDQVPSVMLPWWDWTSDEAQATGLPAALTDETYQDLQSGETKPNPLASAFSQFTGQPTRRNPSPPGDLEPLAAGVDFALAQLEYPDFVRNLENPHNGLHVWMGGDMASVPTAAYDPVFWLHHALVDRVWYLWQQSHPDAAIPPEALAFVCEPFNQTAGQVMDTLALGYSYAEDESLVAAGDVAAAAVLLRPEEADGPAGSGEEPAPPASMSFRLDPAQPGFARATLELIGVEPPVESYVAHIFLNNLEATLETRRHRDVGYAGQLAVFGHGHCLGGPGHCDVPERRDPFDLRPRHHLDRFDTSIDITFPLAALLERQPEVSEVGFTVTLIVADADGNLTDPSVAVFDALSAVTRV